MYILNDSFYFPFVEEASEDGFLAIGGDLKPGRLLLAYKSGIFPWYNEHEPICWWSPDPRFVLFPENLRVSKSMCAVLQNGNFRFTINKAFEEVIMNCKSVVRNHQDGTWINNDMVKAYIQLHKMGYAYSAETWLNEKLVGGLYGIKLNKVFFGESMFSKENNASKFAFINYVNYLKEEGIVLIDCQIYTKHLESLGASMIERKKFIQLLGQHC